MKTRNVCKKCGSKTVCTKYEIKGLNITFWLCDKCLKFRKKTFLPLQMQSIIN